MTKRKKSSGPRFVALYEWEMKLPAYRLMSVYGRALLMEFRMAYTGYNNGDIVMSIRQAAKLLQCNKDTALKYLVELQDKGWVCQMTKGHFSQKTDKTASTWRITNQPIGHGVEIPATKEYAKWAPPQKQKPGRSIGTTCARSSDQESKTGATKPDRTPLNCAKTSDRDAPKTPPTGPTTSYTYSSTTRKGGGGQPDGPPSSSLEAVRDDSGSNAFSALSLHSQGIVDGLKHHRNDGSQDDNIPQKKSGHLAS